MRVAPESEGGQRPHRFRRLSLHGEYSLVECRPRTGRQHQIRVHLEHAGHPIVGDKLYGLPESEALRFYERLRLSPEADSRSFSPPPRAARASPEIRSSDDGERQEFVSELPPDLREFLSRQEQLSNP